MTALRDDLCKTVVGTGALSPGQVDLVRGLAELLGVGLTSLGEVLCPYHRQHLAGKGSWIIAGGRQAYTTWPTWPLCALVVLAAEMAAAGEDLAFARDVLRRQPAPCSPEELDEALRAVAAVLLANGWVTDLRDAEEAEA